MKIEVGDMIMCQRDYGIVLESDEDRVTISWFTKGDAHGVTSPSTSKHLIDRLEDAIDGKYNKLIKAK